MGEVTVQNKTILLLSLVIVIVFGNASLTLAFCNNDTDCNDAGLPACGPAGRCVQCNADSDCPSTNRCNSTHTCVNPSDFGILSGMPATQCGCDPLPAELGIPYSASLCTSGTATATVCVPKTSCPNGGVMWQPICN